MDIQDFSHEFMEKPAALFFRLFSGGNNLFKTLNRRSKCDPDNRRGNHPSEYDSLLSVQVKDIKGKIIAVYFPVFDAHFPEHRIVYISFQLMAVHLKLKFNIHAIIRRNPFAVYVGGESGPNARPMQKDWAIEIKDQCFASGTAFFFKQWGGTNKKKPAGCSTAGPGMTCR